MLRHILVKSLNKCCNVTNKNSRFFTFTILIFSETFFEQAIQQLYVYEFGNQLKSLRARFHMMTECSGSDG